MIIINAKFYRVSGESTECGVIACGSYFEIVTVNVKDYPILGARFHTNSRIKNRYFNIGNNAFSISFG